LDITRNPTSVLLDVTSNPTSDCVGVYCTLKKGKSD
jgi:hypothetical protein